MNISALHQLFESSKGIVTDSRKVKQGEIYLALKGERFDGNAFAAQALEMGASYVIVDDERYCLDNRCILVEDGLQCLQALANFHRNTFDIPILAITGSNGKTTTKELVAAVLSFSYRCHFTKGNYNNHIGVPLTLLSMPRDTEVAVIEMGANHQGEIAALCEIARPTHGVITNIGKAHLEGFGGEEGVKKGKSELYKFLAAADGVAFVNLDSKHLEEISRVCKYKVLYKEDDNYTDVVIHQIKKIKESDFVVAAFQSRNQEEIIVKSNLIGEYNFSNIMTAIVVGKYFRVLAEGIQSSITNYVPTNNRSQIKKIGTNNYLLDAYNANPTSMAAALKNFAALHTEKEKVVVLGEMKELGDYSEQEHLALLTLVKQLAFQKVILIGKVFDTIKGDHIHFESVELLNRWLENYPMDNAYVLVKGSRSNQLEKILN